MVRPHLAHGSKGQIPLTTSPHLGIHFPFELTKRCRKLFGVGSKYPAAFSKEAELGPDDRNMLIRIVSVAYLAEQRGSGLGYCHRRLQVQCYLCKRWICAGHFYCQHLNSDRCRRCQP